MLLIRELLIVSFDDDRRRWMPSSPMSRTVTWSMVPWFHPSVMIPLRPRWIVRPRTSV